jgi:hypothetical protein
MSLYVRIKHRFGPRQMEWFMAVITTLWGAVLLLPNDTFAGSSWQFFARLWPEQAWGVLMFLLGIARLGGLFVNGARPDVTPWIRVVSAGGGVLLWLLICYGFALTGVISTWLAVYPVFALAELVNIYRAMHDAGEAHVSTPRPE